MRKFIIERELPAIGSAERQALRAAAQKSNATLKELGPDIQWVESYVAADKTFPDYELSSAIKAWYQTGTYGCFCGFKRWRATRCNFKRGSARPSLLFFTEQRISAARR